MVFLAGDESRDATGAEFVMDGGLVNDVPHTAPRVHRPRGRARITAE
ncbi:MULTISPECIES: hypothetical protein [unclassified Mycolicibacterium]|nr:MULTISPECIES: hypothetical protein [unclassified Mycolicibacterium]